MHLNRLLGVLLAAALASAGCTDGAHTDSGGPTGPTSWRSFEMP